MSNPWIESRLRELRVKGKNKKGLALAMGLPATRISELIKGKRRIQSTEVSAVANYLELPEAKVLANIHGSDQLQVAELRSVWAVGEVQAGVFKEALEWERERWEPVLAAVDPRYVTVRQFGLKVIGPSMDRDYQEGSVVICVKLLDLGRDPRHLEKVIVQRRNRDGRIEATIKQLRVHGNGECWLWPRSNHPSFQEPWKMPKPDAHDNNDDIQIVAVVIGSYRPE